MSRALILTRVYLMIVGRLSASKPIMCKKTCRVEISYGFDDRRHARENCLKQRCHNISNARRFLPSRSAEASWSWNVTFVRCRYPCSGGICFLRKHCPENWYAYPAMSMWRNLETNWSPSTWLYLMKRRFDPSGAEFRQNFTFQPIRVWCLATVVDIHETAAKLFILDNFSPQPLTLFPKLNHK